MSRPKTIPDDELLRRAMALFWAKGFEGTSVADLVEATGANRAGLYGAFGDKRGLFLKALDLYAESFVTAAFGEVEQADAGLDAIDAYFARLIDLAESWGLPGVGCFMANSMTEIAPHDDDALARVRAHVERLRRGFEQALRNVERTGRLAKGVDVAAYASFLAISAQGLWSYARICRDAVELHRYVATLLAPLEPTPRKHRERKRTP